MHNIFTTYAELSESNDSNSVLSEHSGSSASNDQFAANNNEPAQENIKNSIFYANDQSTWKERNYNLID